MNENPQIKIQPLCSEHNSELIRKAKYAESDPRLGLMLASQIALFQGATSTDSLMKKIAGNVHQIAAFGCLACRLPEKWEELLRTVRTQPMNLGAIKNLGEDWVYVASQRLKAAKDETK